MMTAKDFRQEQNYPYNHFTKLTSTGISADYDHIEAFAEAYHQSKVKNLGLFSVSGSFIRPMTKACKVCVSYVKETYPHNEPCKSCNAVKGKDIELWRRPLD